MYKKKKKNPEDDISNASECDSNGSDLENRNLSRSRDSLRYKIILNQRVILSLKYFHSEGALDTDFDTDLTNK
ncbi:hypothetical protein BpHYR1_003713 [Brachionus plicatilis]|uniref:Uncharacterized protein n=1 Tax=Brachionus plicatilis TaxID=10195 RepID=A0A3M7P8G2_BRAPC|nr:hypothetical protein BpHYR1_003713 [Brachionus plicatilis]